MATVAVTLKKVYVEGDRKKAIYDVTLTGSYIAGGETLPRANQPAAATPGLGMDLELNDVDSGPAIGSTGALVARYNDATDKLQLFAEGAAGGVGAELAAGALPGGPLTIRVKALGKGSVATAP